MIFGEFNFQKKKRFAVVYRSKNIPNLYIIQLETTSESKNVSKHVKKKQTGIILRSKQTMHPRLTFIRHNIFVPIVNNKDPQLFMNLKKYYVNRKVKYIFQWLLFFFKLV